MNKEIINDQKNTIHRLQQECTEKTNAIIALGEQLKAKEQECEELKSQIETYSKMLDSTEFRVALTDVRTGEREVWRKLGSKADRYRKALEEIEGLVKNFCKDCDDYEDCNWEKEGCYYSLIPNLKDIINKAKGEGICQ